MADDIQGRLIRLLNLDKLLRSSKKYTLKEISTKLNYSPRTIQRDFDFLEKELGGKVARNTIGNITTYKYQDPYFSITNISLNREEQFAVSVALQTIESINDNEIFIPARNGLLSLLERAARPEKGKANLIANKVCIATSASVIAMDHIREVIMESLNHNYPIKIDYQTDYEIKERHIIFPISLIFYHGDWWLFAAETKDETNNTFVFPDPPTFQYFKCYSLGKIPFASLAITQKEKLQENGNKKFPNLENEIGAVTANVQYGDTQELLSVSARLLPYDIWIYFKYNNETRELDYDSSYLPFNYTKGKDWIFQKEDESEVHSHPESYDNLV